MTIKNHNNTTSISSFGESVSYRCSYSLSETTAVVAIWENLSEFVMDSNLENQRALVCRGIVILLKRRHASATELLTSEKGSRFLLILLLFFHSFCSTAVVYTAPSCSPYCLGQEPCKCLSMTENDRYNVNIRLRYRHVRTMMLQRYHTMQPDTTTSRVWSHTPSYRW